VARVTLTPRDLAYGSDKPEPDDVNNNDDVPLAESRKQSKLRTLVVGFDRVLLTEAGRAVARANLADVKADADEVAGATATAILCAAAASEARLSEYITRRESLGTFDPGFVEAIRKQSNARKQWRLLLRCCVPELNLDNLPEYCALGCLFKLRDIVAHRHARAMVRGEWPPRLLGCIEQGIIPVFQTETPADWTSAVYVPGVALWVWETSCDWLALADREGLVIPG